jgi:hypothetical protein
MLKNLLLLSGFSTFAVIIIIGLNVYHNYSLSSLPASTQTHVIPIPSSFDKKTLNDLKKRKPINVVIEGKSEIVSDDSKEVSASLTPGTPTPTIQASKIASVSATPTGTPLIVEPTTQ